MTAVLQEKKKRKPAFISYNKKLHPKFNKPFKEEELEYMCKYSEFDSIEDVALGLGRTGQSVNTKLNKLRKEGMFDYYKNLNKHYCY